MNKSDRMIKLWDIEGYEYVRIPSNSWLSYEDTLLELGMDKGTDVTRHGYKPYRTPSANVIYLRRGEFNEKKR